MAITDTRPRLEDVRPAEGEHVEAPVAARRPLLRGALGFMGAGAVFVLIQDLIALHLVQALHAAAASHGVGGLPSGLLSMGHHLTEVGLEGAVVYLGFAGAGAVLALLGRRILFVVPALSFVAYGLAIGPSHVPQGIGAQWSVGCLSGCTAWYANPWLGASVDLLLVLVPGVVIAATVEGHRWPGALDAPTIAGIGVALAATVVAYRTTVVVNGSAALPETIVVASFALLAGTTRRWWPWAHVMVALILSGGASALVWNAMYPDARIQLLRYVLDGAVPLLAVVLLASSWKPVASLLRGERSRPRQLLVAANLLNAADAVLTAVAVHSGGAKELNPLVRWMGLPAKLVLVGALTWFLYCRQPSSLIWPVAALTAVLCYHLSGILVNR